MEHRGPRLLQHLKSFSTRVYSRIYLLPVKFSYFYVIYLCIFKSIYVYLNRIPREKMFTYFFTENYKSLDEKFVWILPRES